MPTNTNSVNDATLESDERLNEMAEETEPNTVSSPPQAPDNPNLPETLEETWLTLTLKSPLFPKNIDIHRPKKKEEVQVRASVRRLAYDIGVSPDDLDLWSQNNFYVASVIRHCSNSQENNFDWMTIEPNSRKEATALEATVTKIIQWLFLYDDESTTTG